MKEDVAMCLPQWARALTEAQQLRDVSADDGIHPVRDQELVRNQEAAVLEPQIA